MRDIALCPILQESLGKYRKGLHGWFKIWTILQIAVGVLRFDLFNVLLLNINQPKQSEVFFYFDPLDRNQN